MNDYRPSSPRVALGTAAVAMTAATFLVFVFAPAVMDSGDEGHGTQIAKATSPSLIEKITVLARRNVHDMRPTLEASAADIDRGFETVSADVAASQRIGAPNRGPGSAAAADEHR